MHGKFNNFFRRWCISVIWSFFYSSTLLTTEDTGCACWPCRSAWLAYNNHKLISQFASYFSVSKSVRITGYNITKKSKYERSDASHYISLKSTSLIETIPVICPQCRLTPDTTIAMLLEANIDYSVGSFTTLVIGCQQNNRQFELYIKDGETNSGCATILFQIFCSVILSILYVHFCFLLQNFDFIFFQMYLSIYVLMLFLSELTKFLTWFSFRCI